MKKLISYAFLLALFVSSNAFALGGTSGTGTGTSLTSQQLTGTSPIVITGNAISCPTCGTGTGSVNSGTAFQAAYYGTTGTAISGQTLLTIGTAGSSGVSIGTGYAGTSASINGLVVQGLTTIGTTSPDTTTILTINAAANSYGIEIDGNASFGTGFVINSTASGGTKWQYAVGTTAGGNAGGFCTQLINGGANPDPLCTFNAGFGTTTNFVYGWTSQATYASTTNDTGLSRDSAGVIDVGIGTQGSKAGSMLMTNITASGASVLFTGLATDSTKTDTSVCQDTTTHQLYTGTGTLGICLGTSSARYKKNIVPLTDGITQLIDLKPVNFYYKKGYGDNGAKEQYGFIAEDLIKVLPKLTQLDSDGNPNSVDMLGMIPVLVEAIQQQQHEIDDMKLKMKGK